MNDPVPHHGRTRHGHIVHLRTVDHHRTDSAYQRINKAVAVWIITHVGTMTCFWIFNLIALIGLPATIVAVGVHLHFGILQWLTGAGFILLVQWVAQSYLQLVLLPSIIVGQNLQSAASDVRAAKTFEDTEKILDAMDVTTAGGLAILHESLGRIEQKLGTMTPTP